jgi:hypothetical protein
MPFSFFPRNGIDLSGQFSGDGNQPLLCDFGVSYRARFASQLRQFHGAIIAHLFYPVKFWLVFSTVGNVIVGEQNVIEFIYKQSDNS